MNNQARIVVTGIGLSAPNGNSLQEFRQNLLAGESGIGTINAHYMGEVIAGACDFDTSKYQTKKELRRGTRAGAFAIYCSHEALADAELDIDAMDKSRVSVYLGITEHGNVQTEKEIYNIKQFNYDIDVWSHHHSPRSVANEPAGEVTINMGITGPHYTLGGACAAGNLGLIHGAQMLLLDEVDLAWLVGFQRLFMPLAFLPALKTNAHWPAIQTPRKHHAPLTETETVSSPRKAAASAYWKD